MEYKDGVVTNRDENFEKVVLNTEQVKAVELVIEKYLLRNEFNKSSSYGYLDKNGLREALFRIYNLGSD